ncbi:tRNA 5-hydroxyuridine modification protein YegQ [Allofrancisella guangzhouensis]|uniref:Protease n=1 Tax=Allofrancisella guangzhouensis TaxID=594679 RepID=A0A0A8E4E2_9GAMM|nr:tRNA 5-hydroxyuridine modification protein YegQ [Allofrancisella guangzhouensis]AJC48472.1 protease [Allofrancisella guangzhouensis]MBK2027625.1 tRNA 5-hydroxyuridine modification protein YegQ [Allofrancisella guangzhouensis]MBK2044062.1 tRNA 5-hydroxyuridine modification protein YegQ [Allofrancisella guangzhouensis]MBK2046510.1 tRNA 5-hydroxyuridine modification protein YegQ [Allofrancisella guangzhouensis]
MKRPELLSPAGTLKAMRYAFAYGADAVYVGQPRYSLRARNNEFSKLEVLQTAINEAHALGKKIMLANNIAPHNAKIRTYIKDITPVIALKPDAMIMSDPGMIMLIREHFPDQEIHLSVQANAVNYETVRFWQKFGIKRVVLSRELSLKEIAEIKENCPDMEIETFVHGSLCMAYSGRCLLSGYYNHRDPNQGVCNNACRNNYKVTEAKQNEWGDIVPTTVKPTLGIGKPSEKIVLIENDKEPGQYNPMFEDEHGTYIMNSKDLRAIQHVEYLTKIGVDCFKIEGRTKSFFYAARTAQLYNQAIKDTLAEKPFDMTLMDKLEGLAHRGYTEGFYRRHVHDEYQKYDNSDSRSSTQQFVGEITHFDEYTGYADVNVRNKIKIGDSIELMLPSGNRQIIVDNMLDKDGHHLDEAKGSGYQAKIRFDNISPEDMKFALMIKNL